VVLLRPSLRRAWIARERDRIAALERAAAPFARRVFRLAGRFDAQALTRHLLTT